LPELANPMTDLTIPLTDQTIVNALLLTLLLLTSPSLFVVRPSVPMTTASTVANPGLPDLLTTGLHVPMDGTLRSLMSMSSPSAKVASLATNVGTSLPIPETDTTDKPVSNLLLHKYTTQLNTRRLLGRSKRVLPA